jgi:Fe-Mn family superoxide dismutase
MSALNRRQFLYLWGGAIATWSLSSAVAHAQTPPEIFTLPPLPYAYDALEPYIDGETMRFHHDKHHAAYVRNLNAAVSRYPQWQMSSAQELVKALKKLPRDVQTTIRNNGGGHLNHTLFWEIMTPGGSAMPTGALAEAITRTFGDFAAVKTAFNQAGASVFGSGWVWLVGNKQGQLQIITTPNQDSPLMQGLYPIIGNDVWEHAYYLKYRNNRADYLSQWWNVVNWDIVNQHYLDWQKSLKKT